MKKIILAAIILAAAGGALYYYFNQKEQPSVGSITAVTQTALEGDWQIDSVSFGKTGAPVGAVLSTTDSNYLKYTFRFQKDSSMIQLLGDSILPVKHAYQWKDSSGLVLMLGDSLQEKTTVWVNLLNEKQFSFQTADSTVVHLKKVK